MPIPKPSIGDLPDTSHQLMQNILVLMPFVDGSGTTLTDFSGNNVNGALVSLGGSPWISDQGGAIQFNATGHVNLGNINTNVFGGDFTIVVELFHLSNVSGSTFFSNRENSTGMIFMEGSAINAGWVKEYLLFANTVGFGPRPVTVGSAISLLQWQRIVITRNGVLVSMYVDGVQNPASSDNSSLSWANAHNFYLGEAIAAGLPLFSGQMSDFRVYDRGFNASDVALDFSDPWSMFPPPPQFISGCVESDQMARVLGISTRFQER